MSTVMSSPYKLEIDNMLKSSWSPEQVHSFLSRFGAAYQKGERAAIPSAKAIQRYRRGHIPPTFIVPVSSVRQLLKGVRYQVDHLDTIASMIWLLEQRAALCYQREQKEGKFLPETSRTLEMLRHYVGEHLRLSLELGLLRQPKPEVENAPRPRMLVIRASQLDDVLNPDDAPP